MAFATACALLAGCSSSASETAGAGSASAGSAAASSNTAAGASGTEGGTYYIACGAPFTGDDAQYGNFFKKALDMKMNEINASGGINGKMIQIDYFDDKSTPKEASNIAQMVTSDSKYIAEIGSYNSTCVLAGAPIYQEAGMVQMAPTAGHPDITTANDHLFRLQNSNDVEYTWLADVAVNKIGAKKIAIVHLENDSGIVLSEILN